MNFSIFIMAFSLITSSSLKKYNEDSVSQMNHSIPVENELMELMNKTMSTMNNIKMNGDFDYDFANLMIMHHQMAIDMSRVEIEKGIDQTIKYIANGIIVAKEIEIRIMQQILQNYKISMTNNQISNSHKIVAEMKLMMDKMSKIKMSKNIDKDYVAMMIPHHQSAVAMAKQQLKYGKQNGLIDLAKNSFEDQNFEINLFKNWQAKN
jgi:uncharacterized protein (DUF305 family)